MSNPSLAGGSKLEVVQDNAVSSPKGLDSIEALADAVKKLLAGPLTERAVVLLVQDNCGVQVSRDTVAAVLHSAAHLDDYVR